MPCIEPPGGLPRSDIRLMKLAGVSRVLRDRKPITTKSVQAPDTRPELARRTVRSEAPNQLWVADTTYVHTLAYSLYAAFVTACSLG